MCAISENRLIILKKSSRCIINHRRQIQQWEDTEIFSKLILEVANLFVRLCRYYNTYNQKDFPHFNKGRFNLASNKLGEKVILFDKQFYFPYQLTDEEHEAFKIFQTSLYKYPAMLIVDCGQEPHTHWFSTKCLLMFHLNSMWSRWWKTQNLHPYQTSELYSFQKLSLHWVKVLDQ